MIALPWKKLCANFILPCGENHYGFFLRCPTSFYNQPAKEFVLITSNANHPAFDVDESNLHIIRQNGPSLKEALAELKSEYGCERITIQSGGTLNSLFLHEKLFDYIDIVIAPVLIGGKDTPTLIDGKSLLSESELSKIGVLKLQECMVLKKSYLRLRYKVIH